MTSRDPQEPPFWVYLLALVPPVVACTIAIFQPYVDPSVLFRDPLVVAEDAASRGECCHAYYGLFSQLGGLVWMGGAFVAVFAAAILRKRGAVANDWQFMLAAGALSALLAADDVFQGHDVIYIKLFGIPEIVSVGIYASLAAAYLFRFRRQILESGPGLLAISLAAFACSVVTDLIVPPSFVWHRIAEDGAKLIGIFCWTVFHGHSAWLLLEKRQSRGLDAGQAGGSRRSA